jgi:hypothetical protein
MPLDDLGKGSDQGFEGGLYPGGSSQRPAEHDSAGIALAQVTAAQVQVIWLKEAVMNPTRRFPSDALELRGFLGQIAGTLHSQFRSSKLCFLASRIYGGYATSRLNPEPFAYQQDFAVKWRIEDQVNGDPSLDDDPAHGPVRAPWLSWGSYLWADGLVPRSDGRIWECRDFDADGTHPSPFGEEKVAEILLGHFTTDPAATPWFTASGSDEQRFDFAPTSHTVYLGSTRAGDAARLASSDNRRLDISSTTTGATRFIDGSAATTATYTGTPVRVELTIEGHFTSARTDTIYLWNHARSGWDQVGAADLTTTDTTWLITVPNPTPYLSTLGGMQCRQFSSRATFEFGQRIDPLKFTVVTQ